MILSTSPNLSTATSSAPSFADSSFFLPQAVRDSSITAASRNANIFFIFACSPFLIVISVYGRAKAMTVYI
jgi:hypothetical protein